ncbi:MAG TPA: metalloregulator ArsR/SmtB family transcription factor [Candidatus Saccharimonadales bacterium]|nr:metalloregulator ArsR/SmtB family transcription factor [Candidatus Saccharimonadales bacterium]
MVTKNIAPEKLSKSDKRVIHILQVLGDTSRYKMFKILLEKKQLCVSEIADKLNISVPAVSQHFRTFELVGIVEKERMGQKICYQLKNNDELIRQLVKIANKSK